MGTNWSQSKEDSKESGRKRKRKRKRSSVRRMTKGSMESIDSGVSLKSDWSRNGLINFKDSSSLSRSELSSYKVNNPVSYTEWVESSYSGMPRRRTQSDAAKSNFLIPLTQQSPVVEEMNLELSSEVRLEHR